MHNKGVVDLCYSPALPLSAGACLEKAPERRFNARDELDISGGAYGLDDDAGVTDGVRGSS